MGQGLAWAELGWMWRKTASARASFDGKWKQKAPFVSSVASISVANEAP